jgi:hypothetical protein
MTRKMKRRFLGSLQWHHTGSESRETMSARVKRGRRKNRKRQGKDYSPYISFYEI